MPARKTVGQASELLTGVAVYSRPWPQPVTRDDAYYNAKVKAARPAILLYLNGKGPRPKDFWLWHDASQDRKALRRLHTKGLARDDPRYFDALIEAARAGDPLSKKEMKDLAEHVRVMDDGFYPALQNRASELSAEAQALGRTVGGLETEKKIRRTAELDNLSKGNAAKRQREKELRGRVCADVNKVWPTLPSRPTIVRSVQNIIRKLCDPDNRNSKKSNMKRYKYRWRYHGKKEILSSWTIRRYVNDAVKTLKAASAWPSH